MLWTEIVRWLCEEQLVQAVKVVQVTSCDTAVALGKALWLFCAASFEWNSEERAKRTRVSAPGTSLRVGDRWQVCGVTRLYAGGAFNKKKHYETCACYGHSLRCHAAGLLRSVAASLEIARRERTSA